MGGLSSAFEGIADESRVRADVAALAQGPRGTRHHPVAMAAGRAYVTAQLSEAGWQVRAAPFDRRWVLGVTDAGGRTSIVRRLRLFPRLQGVNLLADLPGPPTAPASSTSVSPRVPAESTSPPGRVLIVAHLDSVACGPGADDNASGVAVLLECARLLASLPEPPAVSLAIVDMEELAKVGSGALARDPRYRRDLTAVICLESVGTFDRTPGSQHLGGLGLIFPDVARRVRANQFRGDFVLAVGRSSTSSIVEALIAGGAGLSRPLPILGARDPRPDGWRGRLLTGLCPPLINLDRSDHAPFWHRSVPSLMLTTTAPFRNRHYHLAGDTPEKLDYARMTSLAAVVAGTAATVPGEGVPPGYVIRPSG